MTVSVFLNFFGSDPGGDAATPGAAFIDGPLDGLTGADGLRFIEIYQPAAGDVTAFDDGPGPILLVECNLESLRDAKRLLRTEAFRDASMLGRVGKAAKESVSVDVFEPVHYSLPDFPEPPARIAPLSFVVRYFGPVADEVGFVDFYTRNHPPLLAQFPRIRNVLCYLPTRIDLPAEIRSSGAFLGNEVVFDSLNDLNHALASEVLELVKADGRRFASFGHNTHHAMLRRTAYLRPS